MTDCASRCESNLDVTRSPSAAVLDSQIRQDDGKRGAAAALTATRTIIGRKRHLLVDTEGLMPRPAWSRPQTSVIATEPKPCCAASG